MTRHLWMVCHVVQPRPFVVVVLDACPIQRRNCFTILTRKMNLLKVTRTARTPGVFKSFRLLEKTLRNGLATSGVSKQSYLVNDPKYSFLKDLGLGEENLGLYSGKWGASGEVLIFNSFHRFRFFHLILLFI